MPLVRLASKKHRTRRPNQRSNERKRDAEEQKPGAARHHTRFATPLYDGKCRHDAWQEFVEKRLEMSGKVTKNFFDVLKHPPATDIK